MCLALTGPAKRARPPGPQGRPSSRPSSQRWRYLAVAPAGATRDRSGDGKRRDLQCRPCASRRRTGRTVVVHAGSTRSLRSSRNPRTRRSLATKQGVKTALQKAWDYERKHAGGNPKAAKQRGDARAEGDQDRPEPAADQADQGRHADRQAADHPGRVQRGRQRRLHRRDGAEDGLRGPHLCRQATCRTAHCTTGSRTRHSAPYPDNNTFWVPDFSTEHFNKLLYTKEGLTAARAAPTSIAASWHRHLRLHDAQPLP